MADLLGDNRDELDGCRASSNDSYTLAGEIDLPLGPPGGVKRLALEAIDSPNGGL